MPAKKRTAEQAPPDNTPVLLSDTPESAIEGSQPDKVIVNASPEDKAAEPNIKGTVCDDDVNEVFAYLGEDTNTVDETAGASADQSLAQYKNVALARRHIPVNKIITIERKTEVETLKEREAIIWHDVRNAYYRRLILTGTLSGLESLPNGKTIVVVIYKNQRVIIPLSEMSIRKPGKMKSSEYLEYNMQKNIRFTKMLGADIDFIIKGVDFDSKSIVASRREAMLRKRQLFYLTPDITGAYRINENRIVQARIIAVSERTVHFEVFGVECFMLANDMSWDWVGDAKERYNVGEFMLVKVTSVERESAEKIRITIDPRSVNNKQQAECLEKCQVQGKYVGRVTDVHNGIVYIRLSNGANAVAHSCLDRRYPGKHDDVSFTITQIDEEHVYAVGIITRIIKQNL